MFPAELLGTASVRAWRAVLPPAAPLFAVGGIGEDNVADFRRAGASGAGIGSALYRPGVTTADLNARASRLMSAWQGALHRA
jgi:2-dehydro-3-deoxyphosphogalactonate aldolase